MTVCLPLHSLCALHLYFSYKYALGKLSPRFIGNFRILEQIDLVAYKLALPLSLSSVYDVFHMSMIRKQMMNPTHVVYKPLKMDENLSYE